MLDQLATRYGTYSNYYDYSSSYDSSIGGGILAGFFAVILSMLFILLPIAIVMVVAQWKLFKKAGVPGWTALIPIYNLWKLFEISGYPGWIALVVLVPFVGQIAYMIGYILASILLARKFQKEDVFAVVLILLAPVGFAILGFGKATYNGNLGHQLTDPLFDMSSNVAKPNNTKASQNQTTNDDTASQSTKD